MKVSPSACTIPPYSHGQKPYAVPRRTQNVPLNSDQYDTPRPSSPTSEMKINETASGIMTGIVFGAGIAVAAALIATGNIGPCGSPTLASQCGSSEAVRLR